MWNDKITRNNSLNYVISISEIKKWLVNKGIYKLSDIILWDSNGNWDAWSLPIFPERDLSSFNAQLKSLLDNLSGMAPIHLSCKDSCGWGSSRSYFAPSGFLLLQSSTQISSLTSSSSLNAAFWKMVWNLPSIPKLNFFTWTLMHQKLLTGENLLKIGFLGPYR